MENKLQKTETFRIIKFRAWHPEYKKMEYPTKQLEEDIDYWDGVKGSVLGLINSSLTNQFIVFMQYTGLKDINGREIYEGDLFPADHLGNIYRVAWNNEAAKFGVVIERTSGKMIGIPKIAMQDLCKREICGNICQNPISAGL